MTDWEEAYWELFIRHANLWTLFAQMMLADEISGELAATKALLKATQEQHAHTIADFCALRDALPREQVEQILADD